MSSTFSSFQFTAAGPEFKHEIIQVTKPTPAEGQVVIKNAAVAINPLDAKRVAFNMMIASYPVGGGFEVSGTIDSIGAGVTNVGVGDEVFATVGPSENPTFGFQEYTVTRATNVALKPTHLSFEEASSLPVVYHAALSSLHFGLGIAAPFLSESKAITTTDMKTVLILGGASGTGASAIQLLRILAPSTIILTTASSKHFEHVKSLGADHVFDYNSASIVDEISKVAPEGVNAFLDFVSGAAANPLILQAFGEAEPKKYAAIMTGVDVDPKLLPEGLSIVPTTMANIAIMPSGFKDSMKWLQDAVAKKEYKVPQQIEVVGRGLEVIPDGLEKSFKGVSGRKLVVQF